MTVGGLIAALFAYGVLYFVCYAAGVDGGRSHSHPWAFVASLGVLAFLAITYGIAEGLNWLVQQDFWNTKL